MTNPVMQAPYPWLANAWQQLVGQHRAGRLHHALLLIGPQGIGKQSFAQAFAGYLLCQEPAGDIACGQCKSCLLRLAGTHPDLLLLEPEAGSAVIKIDQIREAMLKLGQTAQQGGYRLLILAPAHALNLNAANALLKQLEEPGKRTVFLLLSHAPSRIPATVVSRCAKLMLPPPARLAARAWLQDRLGTEEDAELLLRLSGEAPLAALVLKQAGYLEQRRLIYKGLLRVPGGRASTAQIAQEWQTLAPEQVLELLQSWSEDLARLKAGVAPEQLRNQDLREQLQKIARHIHSYELYSYLDRLTQARAQVLAGHNLNKMLLYEDLLIAWLKCCTTEET